MMTPISNEITVNKYNHRERKGRQESANFNEKCKEIALASNCSSSQAKNARNHKENEQFFRPGKYSQLNNSTRSSKRENDKKKNILSRKSAARAFLNKGIKNRRAMSTTSQENGIIGNFKTPVPNKPEFFSGSVRLPFIASGASPVCSSTKEISLPQGATHQYPSSKISSYAVGIGKTTSTSHLKATVSGGTFTLTGGMNQDKQKRIEYKLSPSGGISQVASTRVSQEREPLSKPFHHKFRQKVISPASTKSLVKNPAKNRFPLPFTGIEYPFIDGGGITSYGRDGIFSEKKPYIKTSNDFEKSWIYSMPDKSICTPTQRPIYKKKSKIDAKREQVVYDCSNPSPFYTDSYQATQNTMIDLNREYVPMNERDLIEQKTKTSGPKLVKDLYYRNLLPYYAKENEADNTLIFESRFESGNLQTAIKKSSYEYELLLKTDYNTTNYTQWFYFKVTNMKRCVPYTFKIVNMVKPSSLYSQGMKVLSYSVKSSEISYQGWQRVGKNISYTQNTYKKKGGGKYYTLSFTTNFDYDNDCVYFAHCFPYTYTDLKYFLHDVCTEKMRGKIRKTFLSRTLAGNEFEGVIITNFTSAPEDIAERQCIIITGRVHPGESNSSFIVEGMIKFLVTDDHVAKSLRNMFVFKIVPMLNPDGVIVGNYRCSLAGCDLNRQWKNPSARLHPEIHAVKQMFNKTLQCRSVFLYVDCHGHSRKKNCFMYGCNNKSATGYNKYKEKIIPFMFGNNHDSFSFKDCNFVVQKAREGTARYVVHDNYNIINSYTLEASFFGPEKGIYQDCHFTPTQYNDIGKKFCFTLLDYCAITDDPQKDLNDKRGATLALKNTLQNLDKYFSKGKGTSNSYLKFMSKGDESDSADDDADADANSPSPCPSPSLSPPLPSPSAPNPTKPLPKSLPKNPKSRRTKAKSITLRKSRTKNRQHTVKISGKNLRSTGQNWKNKRPKGKQRNKSIR
ncbi:unnamed protein product [Moneuplotes crassus]|uniref:Peptidase M14 domain-containing protein n=1 Tax=Euplotes crassus TaxID=5936 RepID=A0AAD2D7N9_EUPCR|nr:unnamed protein product [Moneuplotes crassus]